jgi:hypothetical protein
MSFQLQIEKTPGYLAVRLIGKWEAEDVWLRYEFMAEQCVLAERNKLLIDATKAHLTISRVDAFFLGEKSQIFMKHRLKVAAVGKPERADSQNFAELVAQNRGVRIRVFRDLRAAEEWLLSD